MNRPRQSRLARVAVWALGALLGTAQASPLLRTPAFIAARELATANSSNPMGSPWPAASLPSSSGSTLSLPWNALLPNATACPTGVCMALPPAMSASAALLNFQMQNQCTISLTPVSSTAACQPVAGMSVSANYLNAMLPTFEGDVPQYYNDSQCNCTAGVGHLVQHGQCPAKLAAPGKQKTPQATDACVKNTWWQKPNAFPGASVSQAQITAWEKEDIAWAVKSARNLLAKANITHVTQNEFDGLVDLIYNGGLYKSYHIANYINAGNFEAAIKSNTRRGKNNHLPQNRIEFENSGLAQGELCK